MRTPRVIQALTRAAAAHRKFVGGAVACAVVLVVALFKAHGRMSPWPAFGQVPITSAASGDPAASSASNGTASATFHGWLQSPVSPVTRNLFYINLEQFRRANVGPAGMPGGLAGAKEPQALLSENPAEVAKSAPGRSEETEEPESGLPVAERVAREAGRLHLQSVVMGTSPRAMVDGQLLGEGDVVANFRVLKIEARGITVEREGIMLEVTFKN